MTSIMSLGSLGKPGLRLPAYAPSPARLHGLPNSSISEQQAPPFGRRGVLMSVRCSVKAPVPSNEAAPSPAAPIQRRVLEAINDATKYVVLLVCFGLVIGLRSVPVVWSITGSIGAAFLCKALKYILNHSRPDGAPKSDPGMPSSHATTLSYMATALCLFVVSGPDDALLRWGAAAAIGSLTTFLVWLRVELGYHTTEQVAVGAAVGSAFAALWHYWSVMWVFPACEASFAARFSVYATFGVMFAAFLQKMVAKWATDKRKGVEASKG